MKKYRICDLTIEFDFDERFIHERFDTFECDPSLDTDIVFELKEGGFVYPEGLELSQNGSFRVGQLDGNIYVHYEIPDNPDYYAVRTIVYEKNGKKISYYIRNNFSDWESEEATQVLRKYLFLFFREALFNAVRMVGGISIHSASVIYKEKGIVFSAPAQTGKSTHSNMWEKNFGTPVLDGDITVCRIIGGVPYIYGLPWAGTSGKLINRRVELAAVVFLEQRPENVISVPQGLEAFSRLYSRSFSPRWLPFQVEKDIENTNAVLESGARFYVLGCKPEIEAANLMKAKIDSDIE